jgi:hypothetical protein
MDSRIKKYIKTEVVTEDTEPQYILIESLELQAIIAALNKTMAELEKKKALSADILMDFKAMQKRIEKIVKKPILAKEAKIIQDMLDKLLKE